MKVDYVPQNQQPSKLILMAANFIASPHVDLVGIASMSTPHTYTYIYIHKLSCI